MVIIAFALVFLTYGGLRRLFVADLFGAFLAVLSMLYRLTVSLIVIFEESFYLLAEVYYRRFG